MKYWIQNGHVKCRKYSDIINYIELLEYAWNAHKNNHNFIMGCDTC